VPPRQAQAHHRSQIPVPPAQMSPQLEHGNPLAGVTAPPFSRKSPHEFCVYVPAVVYTDDSAVNPGIFIASLLSVGEHWVIDHSTALPAGTCSIPSTAFTRSQYLTEAQSMRHSSVSAVNPGRQIRPSTPRNFSLLGGAAREPILGTDLMRADARVVTFESCSIRKWHTAAAAASTWRAARTRRRGAAATSAC
jgi:hypothetical protein